VAAVKTEVAADKVLAALAASGFKPHITKEGGYYKVRVGHYADKASAQATAADIKAKLGGAPFVVEES
jgi:cell division protein FtsN